MPMPTNWSIEFTRSGWIVDMGTGILSISGNVRYFRCVTSAKLAAFKHWQAVQRSWPCPPPPSLDAWYVGSRWSQVSNPTPMTREQARQRCEQLNASDPEVKAGSSPFYPTRCRDNGAI